MREPADMHAASAQAVPSSIDKHRQLMVSVLADQRITELQQRGGAWLAGLANNPAGPAQKSPDCRYQDPTMYRTLYLCMQTFIQKTDRVSEAPASLKVILLQVKWQKNCWFEMCKII